MLQAVLTQDHNRALCVQAAVDQTLRNVACRIPGLCVSHMAPITQAAIGQFDASCKQCLGGLDLCPVLQTVCQAIWKCLQILICFEVVRTGHTIF